ncbi:MAG: hypothetical protein KC503_18215 [Myxococcales bacterium]|nr:hypothetical protein [Myxococcales bacterium]
MTRRYQSALVGFVSLWLVVSCKGVVDRVIEQVDTNVIVYFDTGVPTEGGPPPPDSGPTPPDGAPLIDAPQTPGDPCPTGTCGGNAICVAAICRATCTQSPDGCNDKTGACPDGEACFSATSFTDACFSATAQTGQTCGSGNNCVEGNVCVRINNGSPRCLSLCKYGCQPGQQCVKTSNLCSVCL